jgi:hypothetical protein
MARLDSEMGDIYYYVQQLDILEKNKTISLQESTRLIQMIFSMDNENTIMAQEIIKNLVTGANKSEEL